MSLMFDPVAQAEANALQQLALDPLKSVWISANAGTGKTEVLTRRLLALLLADETLEPRHILALTFTNAGAMEMAARLPRRLQELAALPPAQQAARLKAEINLEATPQTPARLAFLAAEMQSNPPHISTLHGLAQKLLTRFPQEANVPVGFTLLEETARATLLVEVQHKLLTTVTGPLAEALATLLDELGEHGWRDLSSTVVANMRVLREILQEGGLVSVLARLRTHLGLQEGQGDAARPLWPNAAEWQALQAVAAVAPDHQAAKVLSAPESLREQEWRKLLLTKEETARASVFVKAIKAQCPADAELLQAAAPVLEAAVAHRKRWRQYNVTEALLLWAHAVQAAYTQAKAAQEALDFDDLLAGLEHLLNATQQGTLAEWVWYALERRFRHLVVDEAQDNNAQQTRIVQHFARHLLSGDVGDALPRTVLAVGDVKQCIFHFQGARPDLFLQLREDFKSWAPGSFREVQLSHSFRTGAPVLAAVDAVFTPPELSMATKGESTDPTWHTHKAVAAARPGRVEVWPLVEAGETETLPPWTLPHTRRALQKPKPAYVCAQQVAAWLKAQYAAGLVLPSTAKGGRPARPLAWEDVMIVVQKNDTAALFAGVLRAAGIPVAGGGGVEPPVVADAIALLRWVFNPADTLALAQVLKAFRGWDDTRILALAAQARATAADPFAPPVWHPHVQGEDAAWLQNYATLQDSSPLELVARIAAETGEQEALTPLLDEAAGLPHLRALVARLEAREQAGKPLPVAAGGAGVRILTVHGSKGLESPLVIAPETTRALDDVSKEKILWPSRLPELKTENLPLLASGADLSELGKNLRKAAQAQARVNSLRGLYVTMTRAADMLVVCGWQPSKTRLENTWYGLVKAAAGREAWPQTEGVFAHGQTLPFQTRREDEAPNPQPTAGEAPTPAWTPPALRAPDISTPEQTRGEQLHALLQGLAVEAPADVQAEAAAVRAAHPWLFAPGSRAEVPVALVDGTLGRIDKLAMRDGVLWVIDFKTGAVPATPPAKYVAQVQAYVQALQARGASVRGALLWTSTATLTEV